MIIIMAYSCKAGIYKTKQCKEKQKKENKTKQYGLFGLQILSLPLICNLKSGHTPCTLFPFNKIVLRYFSICWIFL